MLGLALRSSICSPIRTSIRSPSGTCSRAIAVTALLITAAVMRRNVLLVLTEQRCEKLLFRQTTCRLADLQASSAAHPGSRSLARAAHGSSLHSRAQLAARQRAGKNTDGIEEQKHDTEAVDLRKQALLLPLAGVKQGWAVFCNKAEWSSSCLLVAISI